MKSLQNVSNQSKDYKRLILKYLFIITIISAVIGYICLMMQVIKNNFNFCGWFPDFAEVLSYCAVKNPYDGSSGITAIYPPISYLIFWPFLIFCWNDIQALLTGQVELMYIYTRPMFVVAYIIYFVLTLTLILLVIAKMSKLKGKNLFYLLGTIIFSGPLYFVFNRGNVIFTTFLFVLIFFWLYQSEKRWQRELSLVCLAMAIAMKIYPVLLVLVLLQQRRWLDIVKTGVYSIILVFLPFVFVSGNLIDNIICILDSYQRLVNFGGFFINSSVSFNGVAIAMANWFNYQWGIDLSNGLKIFASILKFLLVIVAIIIMLLCYRSTKKFEITTVVIGCYIFFQNVSYAYVLIFTFLLFVLFLDASQTENYKNLICNAILFAMIFFVIPLLFRNAIIQFFALLILVVKSIVILLLEYIQSLKSKNAITSDQLIQINGQKE